jgi:hypothetical protein
MARDSNFTWGPPPGAGTHSAIARRPLAVIEYVVRGRLPTLCVEARIATAGRVVGIDLSSRMLEHGRTTAAAEGLGNVTFEQGDAQVHPFAPAAADLATSAFGAMFFADPDPCG